MKKAILALFALMFAAHAAFAQSSPGLTYGQVPTAGQWNSYFAAKQDVLGYTPVNRGGDTMFGPLRTMAPSGASAGLIVTPGLIPTAPADGSVWFTINGMFIQVNGHTIGPVGGGSTSVLGPNSSTVGNIVSWNNTSGSLVADSGKALPAGAVVGTTDSQTLTNKSMDASSITSGTFGLARGGTGATTFTANGILLGNGASAIAATAAMTNGQLLVGQTSAVPLPKTISGDATLANTGALTVASIGGNPPGTAANNLVQLNGSGALPAVSGANLTGLPTPVPVRHTALSGPQSSGLPSFLPATSGSLSLTSQNISTGINALVVTAANGFGATGGINLIGIATANQTWSSLAASSTVYLGETVSGGALTTLSTATAPGAQCGGTIPVTNGQYTFDTCGYQMYLGNGSVANPVNVVFVGEAVTSGSAVTSTIAYAYQGKYDTGFTLTIPAAATVTTQNSNIGTTNVTAQFSILNTIANLNYNPGDIYQGVVTSTTAGLSVPMPFTINRNTTTWTTGATIALSISNKTTGAAGTATGADWLGRVYVQRNY